MTSSKTDRVGVMASLAPPGYAADFFSNQLVNICSTNVSCAACIFVAGMEALGSDAHTPHPQALVKSTFL